MDKCFRQYPLKKTQKNNSNQLSDKGIANKGNVRGATKGVKEKI